MELRNLTWLTIPDRALFFKMIHLFKIRHKLAPSYLTPNFSLLFDSHKHNTRGSGVNFQLTREISLSTCSFSYTAAKQWNALPLDLKETSEFRVFKSKLKKYLLSQYDFFFINLYPSRAGLKSLLRIWVAAGSG